MADDFAQNFQVGANLVVQGWHRQERIQQLRSQEAMRQMQERQLAAQADMLAQRSEMYKAKIAEAQAEKLQMAADLHATDDYYHQLTEVQGLDPKEAQAQADSVLVYKNPKAAELVGKARTAQAKPELADKNNATRLAIADKNNASREAIQADRSASSANLKDAQMQMYKSHADLYKAQSEGRVGGAKGSIDPAEKHAIALKNARAAVESAYASDDEQAQAEADSYLADMSAYMNRTHPDKQAATAAQMLMTKYRETLKASLMDKRLKPEVDAIEQKIISGDKPASQPKKRYTYDPTTGRLKPQ